MNDKICSRRGRVLAGVVLGICLAALLPLPVQAAPETDVTKHPGYVDFGVTLGDTEPNVEVLLKGSLLVLAREAVKDDDPELGNLLSKIEYVRVQVFAVKGAASEELMEKARRLATQLEKKGWELAVRVREEGEQVHVYVLPGKKDVIQGLVIMAVEDEDEAAFINIVGDINPVEIARIGRTLHIDSMDIPIKVSVEGEAKVTVDDSGKEEKSTE